MEEKSKFSQFGRQIITDSGKIIQLSQNIKQQKIVFKSNSFSPQPNLVYLNSQSNNKNVYSGKTSYNKLSNQVVQSRQSQRKSLQHMKKQQSSSQIKNNFTIESLNNINKANIAITSEIRDNSQLKKQNKVLEQLTKPNLTQTKGIPNSLHSESYQTKAMQLQPIKQGSQSALKSYSNNNSILMQQQQQQNQAQRINNQIKENNQYPDSNVQITQKNQMEDYEQQLQKHLTMESNPQNVLELTEFNLRRFTKTVEVKNQKTSLEKFLESELIHCPDKLTCKQIIQIQKIKPSQLDSDVK